jgi:hypothetical protein
MWGQLVIASSTGGLGEVVGRAGIVRQPVIRETLVACTSALVAHPERIASLGRRVQERALYTFGYERMLEGHAQVYR